MRGILNLNFYWRISFVSIFLKYIEYKIMLAQNNREAKYNLREKKVDIIK